MEESRKTEEVKLNEKKPSAIKLAKEKQLNKILFDLTKNLQDTKDLYDEKKWREILTDDLQRAVNEGFDKRTKIRSECKKAELEARK